MTNIIQTHFLGKRFSRLEAVHSLNLAVPEGSVFALLGPNGAGKTTVIKLLANLLLPTSGQSEVLGKDSSRLSPEEWRQIGYVSENQELPDWMTVRQMLDYCRPFYATWDLGFEKQLLAEFGLPLHQKIKHLSRGMKAKIALLSAIAFRPRLLILDEPFSGLDPLAREEMLGGILELTQQERWTILVSSHDMEEVERLADWVGILNEGRLMLAEPVEQLRARFRRIDLVADEEAPLPPFPIEWHRAEKNGRCVQFVVGNYEQPTTEDVVGTLFPSLVELHSNPMTLRDIYLSLARNSMQKSRSIN